MSLAQSAISTMLPISNAERAQEFYTDRLGLPFDGINGEGSLMYGLQGGARLMLLPRPNEKPLESTALSFEVTELEREVADLESRGVVFEDYDMPELKTDAQHIAAMGDERAAWFKDPDGNVLCVHTTIG